MRQDGSLELLYEGAEVGPRETGRDRAVDECGASLAFILRRYDGLIP